MASKKFDLEDRTLNFSKKVIDLVKKLSKNSVNFELISQVVRSAGSVGANYREANEALGKKDFYMRVRICRKEAKETKYWLELILHNNPEFKGIIDPLINESTEFIRMFSAMIKNSI
ncbi:four helix bundle protein [Candidatus Daviesbacteria bacterium]|nr:four helix bundle protein [Candidatus Daviesbacteria bacterium]